jgi:tripartite-type tricarboxylate transporter receptor subunit TctC
MNLSLDRMKPMYSARKSANHTSLGLMALPILAALLASPAAAQEACSFFKGKTVELVVPFSPGGGFDIYGRMVAKHFGPELGAANMIVRNQPGAGGLLGTNQTWNAKPDGLRIQLMSVSGMVTSELGGADGVNFKSGDFSWIGRISGEPDVITAAPGAKIGGLADLEKIAAGRKVRMGSSGVGDIDYIEAWLLNDMLGDKVDVVTGFSGSGEVYASLGRGELDLFSSSLTSALAAEKAATGKPLWVFSAEGLPNRPEVKPLSEVVDARYLPLIKTQANVVAAGRALAGPPKIPEDRLTCLREAFERTMKSAPLLEEAAKLNRPVQPLTGAEMAALVQSITQDTPPDYLAVLKQSFKQ